MYDQLYGDDSESMHGTQVSKETVFCNNSKTQTSFNSFALINKHPKLYENSSGDDEKMESTSDQCFLPLSVGNNNGLNLKSSVEFNPVGSLQELCMAFHYPLPLYTFYDENLKNYNEKFTVACSILTYKSTGTGLTKQAAKNQAAFLMYKQLEKCSKENFHNFCDNENEFKDEIRTEHWLQPHKFSCGNMFLCLESVTLLKIFFDSIGASKTPKKLHLKYIKKNTNKFKLTAIDILKTILDIEDNTFKYFTISQNSDEVEVVIQLNTSPVIVISGSGKNDSDALESAARSVLTYFKLKYNI